MDSLPDVSRINEDERTSVLPSWLKRAGFAFAFVLLTCAGCLWFLLSPRSHTFVIDDLSQMQAWTIDSGRSQNEIDTYHLTVDGEINGAAEIGFADQWERVSGKVNVRKAGDYFDSKTTLIYSPMSKGPPITGRLIIRVRLE